MAWMMQFIGEVLSLLCFLPVMAVLIVIGMIIGLDLEGHEE